MLILIEIGLTIWAWARGWKAFALMPMVAIVVLGFFTGALIAAFNLNQQILNSLVLVDWLGIIVLIVMIVKGKETKESK